MNERDESWQRAESEIRPIRDEITDQKHPPRKGISIKRHVIYESSGVCVVNDSQELPPQI